MTMPAPPRIGFGISTTSAAILENTPIRIRMMPETDTTKRLRTPVKPIRPTFCANAA